MKINRKTGLPSLSPSLEHKLREELPIKALRKRLTFSFVWVSLIIYLIAGALSVVIFSSSLNASLSSNVNRLLADLQPAIKLENNELSLKDWAKNAEAQSLHIIHVVQLFDRHGHLKEEHGIPGVKALINGECSTRGMSSAVHKLRSRFVPVQNAGFLQVQVDTKQTDEAFTHFLITMIVLVPVVALIAGGAGHFYCAHAVSPVTESFQVLRQFVDDAGHELRTPVAVISASVQTLEDALAEDSQVQDLLDKVHRASQRLKQLSNNLIELASMESPGMSIDKCILDANTLLMQVCDDFSDPSAENGIELKCHTASTSGGSLLLAGNGDTLQRMLSNLIENAIRYTPSGGNVIVSCMPHGQSVVFTIEDNGIGIPKECLGHIFDRFYRVDKARTREHGGTGLGLSIVKAIVEAHDGAITVSSTLGSGTRFKVQLPNGIDSQIREKKANNKRN
jgi:signal transduction histidine kinase